MSTSGVYLCHIYVNYFSIIFIFITIKDNFIDTGKPVFWMFVKISASGRCLAFAYFFSIFSLLLLMKMLLIKKWVSL